MKINAIAKEMPHRHTLLQKASKHLKATAIGTCLLLSSCAAQAPGTQKDTMQKENQEVVNYEEPEKRPILGDLLFGGAILGLFGFSLYGMKKAEKNQ